MSEFDDQAGVEPASGDDSGPGEDGADGTTRSPSSNGSQGSGGSGSAGGSPRSGRRRQTATTGADPSGGSTGDGTGSDAQPAKAPARKAGSRRASGTKAASGATAATKTSARSGGRRSTKATKATSSTDEAGTKAPATPRKRSRSAPRSPSTAVTGAEVSAAVGAVDLATSTVSGAVAEDLKIPDGPEAPPVVEGRDGSGGATPVPVADDAAVTEERTGEGGAAGVAGDEPAATPEPGAGNDEPDESPEPAAGGTGTVAGDDVGPLGADEREVERIAVEATPVAVAEVDADAGGGVEVGTAAFTPSPTVVVDTEVRWEGDADADDPPAPVAEVGEVELRDGDVREVELRDGDVREVEIRDDDVREVELRDGDVREVEIRDDDVREVELRDGDVREVELRDGDVREVELRDDEIAAYLAALPPPPSAPPPPPPLSSLPPPPAAAPPGAERDTRSDEPDEPDEPGRPDGVGSGSAGGAVRPPVGAKLTMASAAVVGLLAGRRRPAATTVETADAEPSPDPADEVLGGAVTEHAEARRLAPGDEQPGPVGPVGPVSPGAGPEPWTGSLDPAFLATLPPPPAVPVLEPPEFDWDPPDWSVSGTTADGGDGPVLDLSVADVNSDRAVITEPPPPLPPPPAGTGDRPADDGMTGDGGPPTAAPDAVLVDGDLFDDDLIGDHRVSGQDGEEPVPAVAAAAAAATGYLASRHQRRKEWRQVERARRHAARRSVRFPVFTRSILLWMLIFGLMGVSAGGTAAVFWTHFNTQIAQLREETEDFDNRSDAAEVRIEGLRNEAVAEIERRMKELAPALAEPRTVQAGKILSPYVWFVSTLDESGVASVGTAFSVASDQRSTWLLTSYNIVKAGTVRPAPPLKLRKDPEEIDAELVSWDAANDLALIRMDRPSQPVLEWAPEDVQSKLVGNRLYVVTGFGGAGATLNSAMAIDQNARGILHDGRIGTAAQGGPIVTTDGKVVGIASLVYRPLGFDPGELHYAVSVRRSCDVLLTCTTEARRVRVPG